LTRGEREPSDLTVNARGPILLFDGVCNFCNWSVQFVIDRDRSGEFRFASLQSEVGRALLQQHGLGDLPLSTMVLIDEGKAYLDSEGVLRTARRLGGALALLAPFLAVPRALRDPLYRAFARNRYRLFGTSDRCLLPTPELRSRFLDQAPGAPHSVR
jgi:predicted DCC family thiol-disulfide oxidoreductase YuxK